MKIKCVLCKRVQYLLLAAFMVGCEQAEFVDAKGNHIHWHDYQGQWLVINYWAEWCKPCREEIPELNRLHGVAGQQVLGVNFDWPNSLELQRQINALAVQFPVVQSEQGRRLFALTPQVLPTTYVFDRQGSLLHKLVGPQTQQSIEAVIKE